MWIGHYARARMAPRHTISFWGRKWPTALTPLQIYGLWAMAGTFAVLFAFIGLRGRVPIEPGWGGMTIQRFTGFERVCHWLLALSFLVLAR